MLDGATGGFVRAAVAVDCLQQTCKRQLLKSGKRFPYAGVRRCSDPWRRMMRSKPMIAGGAVAAAAVALVVTAGPASAAPTRYEAESSPAVCVGTIDNEHSGFSGSGFCNGN